MSNNTLWAKILARLDKNKSKKQINTDIKQLEKTPFYLSIVGKLNKEMTKKQIKKDLQSINNLNVAVDVNFNPQQAEQELQHTLNNIYSDIDIDIHTNQPNIRETQEELQQEFDRNPLEIPLNTETAQQQVSGLGRLFNTLSSQLLTFVSVQQAITQTVNSVKELDNAIYNLQVATGKSREETEQLLKTYNDMAKDLSVSTVDVSESANSFLRQGYSLKETNELIKASLMLSKNAQIGSAESTEYLTSILKGYKKEASEVYHIIDSLTKIDLESASSTAELAKAMSRVSATAHLQGIKFEELAGYITTVSEVTRSQASKVGNSFNSIFSRMNNIKAGKFIDDESGEALNDVEKVLDSLGIKLRDSADSFRDTSDVLDEIYAKWDSFTDVEQRAIASAISGTYQRNSFIALMDNYDKALEYTETALNSNGTAVKKYEAYTESLNGKITELKANFETIVFNAVDDKTIKAIVTATASLTGFIDKANLLKTGLNALIFTGIIKGITSLGLKMVTVTANVSAFNSALNISKNMSTVNNAMQQLTIATANLNNNQLRLVLSSNQLTNAQKVELIQARALSLEHRVLTQAEAEQRLQQMGLLTVTNQNITATFGLSGALRTLKTVIATNPVGILITALTTGATAIQTFKQKMEEKAEAERQALQQARDNTQAFKEELESLDSIGEKYIDSIVNADNLANAKLNLKSVQEELNTSLADEGKEIDIINGKYSDYINNIKNLKKEKAEQYLFENSAQLNEAKQRQNTDYYNGGLAQFDLQVTTTLDNQFIEELDKIANENISYSMANSGLTKKINIDFGGSYEDAIGNIKAVAEVYEKYAKSKGNYDSTIHQAFIDKATALEETLAQDLTMLNQEKEAIAIINAENPLADAKEQAEFNRLLEKAVELKYNFNNADSGIDKYTTFRELEELHNKLNNIAGSDTDLQSLIDDTFTGITDNITAYNNDMSAFTGAFTDNMADSLKQNIELIDVYKNVLKEVTDGNTIDPDTAFKLFDSDIDKNIKDIKTINGEYQLSANEIIKAKDRLIEKTKEEMQTEINKTMQTIEATKQNIETNKALLKSKQDALLEKGININSSYDAKVFSSITSNIQQQQSDLQTLQEYLYNCNLYISGINSNLGNTVTLTDQLNAKAEEVEQAISDTKDNIESLKDAISDLENKQKSLLKAEETEVQNVIDIFKEREEVLKAEKKVLEEQKELLTEQKKEIEEIIKKYDKVFNIISDVAQNELELIQAEKDKKDAEISNYYDTLIEKLQQENEEREKAITLTEKQANLENAKRNKVRQYNEQSGWTYKQDQEAINTAQNELDSFKTETKISELESEKEQKLQENALTFDPKIEAWGKYIDLVKGYSEKYTEAQNSIIASEILGADWLEKIKNRDTTTLQQLTTARNNYQNQLNNNIQKELDALESVIKAKQREIDTNAETMQQWNTYKSQLNDFVNSNSEQWSDYIDNLNSIKVDEQSTLEERLDNLNQFKANYNNITSELLQKQGELDTATAKLDVYQAQLEATKQGLADIDNAQIQRLETEISDFQSNADFALAQAEHYKSIAGTNEQDLIKVNFWNDKYNEYMAELEERQRRLNNIKAYATGGVNTTTGYAWLDGTPSKPEVVLNNSQATKLWNLLNTMDVNELAKKFHLDYFSQPPQELRELANKAENTVNNTTNNNQTVNNYYNFSGNIVANNPDDFMEKMNRYIQHNKLNGWIKY